MKRTALTVAATLVGGLLAFGIDAPASAVDTTYVHWVGEFEPGSDLEHYADFVLDKVDVPDDEWSSRKPQTGPNRWATLPELDMVWLYLTQEEAADADALIGQAPLMTSEATSIVSLPTPVGEDLGGTGRRLEASGPVAPPGQMGWQEVQPGFERIGVPEDRPPASGVRVAVIDTGIDGRHDDLENVIADGFNCTQDSRGPEGYDIDPHGHGTWIGGLIAARRNDVYVQGIAAGVSLLSEVTFGADGGASGAMVLCALNSALEHDADVISASLGGGEIAARCGGPSVYTNGWCKAARRAVVVVAAGNDAEDSILHAPANVPGVVTVGAVIDYDGLPGGRGRGSVGCGFTHPDDALAVFSDWGSAVDFVAPGGCEVSLAPGQSMGQMSGTSMATPYVSAVFAAFLAEFPDCRGDAAIRTVEQYAQRYADEHPDDGYTGWPGAFPPPMIRYVDEEPLRMQDPDNPTPCAFQGDES